MMGLVADGGEPIKVTAGRVSDNLFKTLGASAALGRTIEPGNANPGQQRVAVFSDSLWRSRFNADPSIIGRGIQLDQEPHTIIGVMPPGFEVFGPGTDLWAPLPWTPGNAQFKATFSQGRRAARAGRHAGSGDARAGRSRAGDAQGSGAPERLGPDDAACRHCRRRSPATCARRC